jgi:hypothetical protein
MIDAATHHLVFTQADLQRLAQTLLTRIWNGDVAHPAFGEAVNSNKGNLQHIYEWVELGRWEPRILDLTASVLAPGISGMELNRALPYAITLHATRKRAAH